MTETITISNQTANRLEGTGGYLYIKKVEWKERKNEEGKRTGRRAEIGSWNKKLIRWTEIKRMMVKGLSCENLKGYRGLFSMRNFSQMVSKICFFHPLIFSLNVNVLKTCWNWYTTYCKNKRGTRPKSDATLNGMRDFFHLLMQEGSARRWNIFFFNATVSFILQLQCIFTFGRQYVNFSYTRIIEIFGIKELLFLVLGM